MAKRDFCSQVWDNDCANPPGYQVGGMGGAVGDNPDGPRITARCVYCGEAVCVSCSNHYSRSQLDPSNLVIFRNLPRMVRFCKSHEVEELRQVGWLPPRALLETEVL